MMSHLPDRTQIPELNLDNACLAGLNGKSGTLRSRKHQVSHRHLSIAAEHFTRRPVHENMQLQRTLADIQRRYGSRGIARTEIRIARFRSIDKDLPRVRIIAEDREFIRALQQLPYHAPGAAQPDLGLELIRLRAMRPLSQLPVQLRLFA